MKALWIPIFSMRSYETGMYAIMKDGNFQLTLARIIASDFDEVTVVLPLDVSDIDAFDTRMAQLNYMPTSKIIHVKHLKYGANAVETRKTFWEDNQDFFYSEAILDFDLLITDITGYAGTMSYDIPFINNFNITKLPELDRPYIDQFFEKDLESMEKALFTTVINPRQREYILEVAPHLKDKVHAYTMVAHDILLPNYETNQSALGNREIFWPFRISDKAYQFIEFVEMFAANKLNKRYKLVITDPNDTFTDEMATKYPFVKKDKLSKTEYYQRLNEKPIVVMLDDIDTVLHPGTIEFFHYGCPVITLENDLIQHSNMVKSIEDIPQQLTKIGYNREVNVVMDDFVYSYSDLSKHYNKNNIQQCVPNS